jgi:hypothetical protein
MTGQQDSFVLTLLSTSTPFGLRFGQRGEVALILQSQVHGWIRDIFPDVGGGRDLQPAFDGRDDQLPISVRYGRLPACLSSHSHVFSLDNSINLMHVVYSQTRIHCLASIHLNRTDWSTLQAVPSKRTTHFGVPGINQSRPLLVSAV